MSVKDLDVEYRTGNHLVRAVNDLTLEIGVGEVFGLVGESGSGKSSLGKCIVGLVIPAGGALSLDRVSIGTHRLPAEVHRKLQLVVQNPDGALNPRHSVGRILRRFVTRLNPRSVPVNARIDHLLAAVRLEPWHLKVSPRSLSGGQKQRVAIACAFAGAPALVVCDEPVSALDVSVQAAILNLLAQLQDGHRVSYLFISHDLGVVRYIADRIGVMYLGELVDVGPSAAVFAPPHHPYTEALLSAVSVNLGEAPTRRSPLKGEIPSPTRPPSGCRFHTRCPRYLGDICRSQRPPWQETPDGHVYRCHIPPEELAQMQRRPGLSDGSAQETGPAPRAAE